MKKIFKLTAPVVAVLVGFSACQKTPEPAPQPVSEDPSETPVVESDDPQQPSDKLVIEHLYPVGAALPWGWDNMAAEEMTNNGGIFTWQGEIKAHEDFKFLLQKEENGWWPGLVRDKDSVDPYAIIVGTGDNMDVKFHVDEHGIYLITINAKDSEAIKMTVELKEKINDDPIVVTELYLLGDSTAWGWSLDDMEAFENKGDGLFTWTGELTAGGELRFPLQKKSNTWWPCLVKGATDGTLAVGYSDNDKNNIDVPEDGTYTINVNSNEMTYTIEKQAAPEPSDITVTPLFGIQPTVEAPCGMTADAHRSIAVVGDYLILSNALDITKMPVYNRFTGEYLGDDIINTSEITGLEDNQKFWAIASDDEGHLAAVTFSDTRENPIANGTVRGFVWKEGLDKDPKSFWWANLSNYSVGGTNAYANMKIAGDLTSDAVILTGAPASGKGIGEIVTNGMIETRVAVDSYDGSLWWGGNIIPLEGSAKTAGDIKYISVSGNFRQYISYCGGAPFTISDQAAGGHWYMGGGQYQRNAVGGDYIKVGSHCLLGVLNGWYAGSQDAFGNNRFYYQLIVSDIGENPTESSFDDGVLFATRKDEGEGMGYGKNGMISPFSYDNQTMLGPNAVAANIDQIGDVVFAKSGDNKVQVYALVMNLGLIGFEIGL